MSLLVLIVAWTTFAFGGVYTPVLVVAAVLLAAASALYKPVILHQGPVPDVDRWLLFSIAGMLLQLVPLPRGLVRDLSPGAVRVADAFALVHEAGPLPIATDATETAAAVLLFTGVVLLFAVARRIFEGGGVRTVCRALAVSGVALACLALAQDATGQGLMYWTWRPVYERAFPFGPFVNRNHFGTWAVMVVPLCLGYFLAHTDAHRPATPVSWRHRVVSVLDGRAWLLLGAVMLLVLAVVVSLSRSAIVGLVGALAAAGFLASGRPGRLRHEPRALVAIAIIGAVTIGGILLRVEPAAIADRAAASAAGLSGRAEIWSATLRVIRDFWITGTGVGTYRTVMAVYQQTSPGVIFNQAHNHYLQVVAEGGVMVGVPLLLSFTAFARRAARSLARDASGMYWVRAGAASGLTGVAIQSLFEAGLLTPANAAVAAVLAAIVVHREPGGPEGPPHGRS